MKYMRSSNSRSNSHDVIAVINRLLYLHCFQCLTCNHSLPSDNDDHHNNHSERTDTGADFTGN